MGRRLVDATKACRVRRTRGETGLRFFLAAVAEADLRFAPALAVDFVLAEVDDAVLAAGTFSDGVEGEAD
jgi:hypothetical protein